MRTRVWVAGVLTALLLPFGSVAAADVVVPLPLPTPLPSQIVVPAPTSVPAPLPAPLPSVIIVPTRVPVPGPVQTVIRTTPTPVPIPGATRIVRQPGPVRTVLVPGPTKTVIIPGPVRTVYVPSPTPTTVVKEVFTPGQERIVKQRIKDAKREGTLIGALAASAIGLVLIGIIYVTGYRKGEKTNAELMRAELEG